MMILAIKLVLATTGAYLLGLAIRRFDHKQKKQKLWVPVVTAVAAVLVVGVTDQVDTWLADPRPRVSAKLKDSEILLELQTHKATSAIAIDFPVFGRIVNIHDYNSPTDAVTDSRSIVGLNVPESGNNVEIVLTDIKPDRPLSFKILYEPMTTKVKVAGTDRWAISYSWLHGGVTITKKKWYLIANGEEVGPPPIQVKSFVIHPRALSPEEIKKEYEHGPPRTLLK